MADSQGGFHLYNYMILCTSVAGNSLLIKAPSYLLTMCSLGLDHAVGAHNTNMLTKIMISYDFPLFPPWLERDIFDNLSILTEQLLPPRIPC